MFLLRNYIYATNMGRDQWFYSEIIFTPLIWEGYFLLDGNSKTSVYTKTFLAIYYILLYAEAYYSGIETLIAKNDNILFFYILTIFVSPKSETHLEI